MIYSPLNPFYKSVLGAVKENEQLTFRISGVYEYANLVVNSDDYSISKKVAMKNCGDFFECDIYLSKGLYFYYFELDVGYISLGENYEGFISGDIIPFQLSVYSAEYKVPTWLNGGIIYQIFPDRFNIYNKNKTAPHGKVMHSNLTDTPIFMPNEHGEVLNNDFFGGDLLGIVEKLEYLKELNVNTIYLNPIFKAYSNHRYDTGDYMQIDELLGSEEDFITLINKANELGIKIVIDGVFNHTGSNSLYFNKNGEYPALGAYQSKSSQYYNWFKFNKHPNNYESWWGISTLPAVNKSVNSPFIRYITDENGVLDHYIKLGVAGVRLDVVDELPAHFVRKIREAVKRANEDAIIIGEVWEDASNKVAYGVRREYFLGGELDSVMNYPLKNAIINFVNTKNEKELLSAIRSQLDHYPKIVLNSLMNFLSTHDTFRLVSALAGVNTYGLNKMQMSKLNLSTKEKSQILEKVKIATLLQYTLFGAVSIYYGDEVGMDGFADPLNRKFFEWDSVDNDYHLWYKKLGEIRTNNIELKQGDFKEIYSYNGALVYKRYTEDSEILVAINLSNKELNIKYNGVLRELLSEQEYKNMLNLKPQECGIYKNIK